MARKRANGLLPFAPLGRDRAVQEVEIVDIALARPDAIQQELGVVQLVLGERGPGGLDQGLGGQLGARLRLRRTGRDGECENQRHQHAPRTVRCTGALLDPVELLR